MIRMSGRDYSNQMYIVISSSFIGGEYSLHCATFDFRAASSAYEALAAQEYLFLELLEVATPFAGSYTFLSGERAPGVKILKTTRGL